MDFSALLQGLQVDIAAATPQDVLLGLTLSFVLTALIGWTYKATYRGTSYTQSYVHTLIIVSMVVSMIMLIIGSNIARAFTLVGALSIVRFRNAVKDTRDVGFIFFALAIGMACGTRFYLVGILSTLVICIVIWIMVRTDMFAQHVKTQLLKIRVAQEVRYEGLFMPVFDRYLKRYELLAVETVQAGTQTELDFSVELKKPELAQEFLNEVSRLTESNKVVLITGQHEVDL